MTTTETGLSDLGITVNCYGYRTLEILNHLTDEPYFFHISNAFIPALKENPELFKEVLEESLGYENFVFAKISFNHWEHLKNKFGIKPIHDEKYTYNFYMDGIEGYLNAYETGIGWSLIINQHTRCNNIHGILISMIENSTMNFVHKGLWTALDSNYGGQDHLAAYYIAQTIMF